MLPVTPTDYTGDGHQHALSEILGITQCKWFTVTATSVASGPGRVGDDTIEADGGGFVVSDGFSKVFPPIALAMSFYDLTKWFILIASGDTVSIGAAV